MGATLRYVKEFEFPSYGKVNVKGYSRGGPVKKADGGFVNPSDNERKRLIEKQLGINPSDNERKRLMKNRFGINPSDNERQMLQAEADEKAQRSSTPDLDAMRKRFGGNISDKEAEMLQEAMDEKARSKIKEQGYARGGAVKKGKDDSASRPVHMAGMSMKARGGVPVSSGAPLIAMKSGGKAMFAGGMVKTKK